MQFWSERVRRWLIKLYLTAGLLLRRYLITGPLIKRYLITGLLIWIPLAITAWVLLLIANTADRSLLLLPPLLRPRNLFGFDIPGIGVAVSFFIIFVTGVLATNFIGQRLVGWWERLLARIPVVSSIYNSVKQVSDTLLSSSGNAFRKALLIRYPHRDIWTIAFLTGHPSGNIAEHIGDDYISVYVPTTPNPTSGFFLMVRKQDVIELDMDVEKALKYIISMGVIAPGSSSSSSSSHTSNTQNTYNI